MVLLKAQVDSPQVEVKAAEKVEVKAAEKVEVKAAEKVGVTVLKMEMKREVKVKGEVKTVLTLREVVDLQAHLWPQAKPNLMFQAHAVKRPNHPCSHCHHQRRPQSSHHHQHSGQLQMAEKQTSLL